MLGNFVSLLLIWIFLIHVADKPASSDWQIDDYFLFLLEIWCLWNSKEPNSVMLLMYLLRPIKKLMIYFTSFWNFAIFQSQRTAFFLVDDVPAVSAWKYLTVSFWNFDFFESQKNRLQSCWRCTYFVQLENCVKFPAVQEFWYVQLWKWITFWKRWCYTCNAGLKRFWNFALSEELWGLWLSKLTNINRNDGVPVMSDWKIDDFFSMVWFLVFFISQNGRLQINLML